MAIKKGFYNLEDIKNVSCVEICNNYGIELKKKGNRYWGKLRNEKTPSFSITEGVNLWYDYGEKIGGGSIQLVQQLQECSAADAIQVIGAMFNLQSLNNTKGEWIPLTDSQYNKIGIQADRASKNIDFDLERFTEQQAKNLSEKLSISIQELAEKNENTYHAIIRNKSIPYIYKARQSYYRALANLNRYIKEEGKESLTVKFTRSTVEDLHKEYKEAYELLKRAIKGKAILVAKFNIGEIDDDLIKLNNGELQYEVGKIEYSQLKKKAKENNEKLRYIKISEKEKERLLKTKIEFSAFSKGNEINMVVAEKDFTNALTVIERDFKQVASSVKANTKKQGTEVFLPFKDLSEENKNRIIERWHEKNVIAKGRVNPTIETIRETFEANETFIYNDKLEAKKTDKSFTLLGNIEYKDLQKQGKLFYKDLNIIDSEKILAKIDEAGILFSGYMKNGTTKISYKIENKDKIQDIINTTKRENTYSK